MTDKFGRFSSVVGFLYTSRNDRLGCSVTDDEMAKRLIGFVRDQPDGSRPALLTLTLAGRYLAIRPRRSGLIDPVQLDRGFASIDEDNQKRITIRLRSGSRFGGCCVPFQLCQRLVLRQNPRANVSGANALRFFSLAA
jgi:hypothetical protein